MEAAPGKKEWQNCSGVLKELLNLEYSPVAVSCIKGIPVRSSQKKIRICRAILDAGKGEVLEVDKESNACFGASWHLGFYKLKDQQAINMVKRFVVEEEKLFSSHGAFDKLMSQMEEAPDNSASSFILSPLEKAEITPDLAIFICNAETACRLLTLTTFIDGIMPKIKIGGPTCRMSIIYPILSGELNISFYDYTARKMCNIEKDKLLVSIPYKKIPKIMESLDRCCAGRARIEYPSGFRQLLQDRLTHQVRKK